MGIIAPHAPQLTGYCRRGAKVLKTSAYRSPKSIGGDRLVAPGILGHQRHAATKV